MKPPTLYEIKADEDPQEFLDEVNKVINAMGVILSEKDELDSYQLKDLDQT